MKTQKITKSTVWWMGLIMVIIQGVGGILTAMGVVDEATAGMFATVFAAVLAYCNGNNPSLKDVYSIKEATENE